MKNFKLISIFTFLITYTVNAQLPSSGVSLESNVLDGVYVQEHIPTKRVVQYQHLREADVMWAKRIWRVIDLREKMNHKLYFPLEKMSDRMCLWDVIKYGALDEGSLTVYDLNGVDNDDKFRYPIKPANGNINDPAFKLELRKKFGREIQVKQFDENDEVIIDDNGDPILKDTVDPYIPSDIVRYELKEDWFFDKQRSEMDVRIIGISPVVYSQNPETGEIVALSNLFWLYFPECRYVFQNFFVYNPSNDAHRMSFDDLFWKREFTSFIKKESNVFDRKISPNWTGLNALLESERIREEMFEKEHDLWHY
ncbi:MAG: gliding motility protein GldN [Flavobacteriales bacterium]|nr:gliding motility protein GldN [Flavobacteriales bacterium]